MSWAARYSRTEQPELTIYSPDGLPWERLSAAACLSLAKRLDSDRDDLRADIAARVPVRECIETDACRNHAVDGERCWDHGGSDEL